jgi:hypothetical protein
MHQFFDGHPRFPPNGDAWNGFTGDAPEAGRTNPPPYQPGYTVPIDPPRAPIPPAGALPEGPGSTPADRPSAAGQVRNVYHNQCRKCRNHAQGRDYAFFVGLGPAICYRVVHEERVFICNQCVQARMRTPAWLVLFCWLPMVFLAGAGALALAYRVWIHGNPQKAAYLPTAGGLFLLALGLLYFARVLVRATSNHLRSVAEECPHQQRRADSAVGRMAIELGKKDVLKRLGLPKSGVRFLTPAERWAQVGCCEDAVPLNRGQF